MLTIFADGLAVLFEHFYIVLIFFTSVLGAGLLFTNFALRDRVGPPEIHFFVALSVGSIVLSLASYGLVILGHFSPTILKFGSFLLLSFFVFVVLRNLWFQRNLWVQGSVIFWGIFFFLLLLLRLGFLKHILLPGYSDSPIHYQIIDGFLHPNASYSFRYSLDNIFRNYYHFGFHSLTAWLVSVSGTSLTDAISLLGQLFLILAPVSMSFLVYVISRDVKGAFFSGLLTAIGWYMPSFAVNWGKFPALAALSTFPAVLGYLLLLIQGKKQCGKNLVPSFLLVLGLSFLHTRIIILSLLAAIAYFVSRKMDLELDIGRVKSILYSILFAIILFPLLQPLQYFYAHSAVLFALAVLLPFSFQSYPKNTVAVFLFVVALWVVGALPNFFKFRELLNKEFFEMVLYIPLSLIGGMGFSGITNKLSRHVAFQKIAYFFFVALVVLPFLQNGAIYPDSCCDYFQESDALAFSFLQKELPENSLVLISSFKNSKINSGTDAGIWIFPLLNLPTNNFFYDANWSVPDRVEQICEMGAEHIFIYVGGRVYSFNDERLSQTEWYELVFRSGKTKIYQLTSCLE